MNADDQREDGKRDVPPGGDEEERVASLETSEGASEPQQVPPPPPPPPPPPAPVDGHTQGLAKWQGNILPWATRFLVWLAVAFVVLTLAQLAWLQWHIMGTTTSFARTDAFGDVIGSDPRVLLEYTVIERRYAQSNALLLSRTWVKYLGFLTGMLMMFVGATYIIGRFVEHEAKLEFGYGDATGALTASSPGIIVSTLGTVVIVMSIAINHSIDTTDGAIYIEGRAPLTGAATDAPVRFLVDNDRTRLGLATEHQQCGDAYVHDLVQRMQARIDAGERPEPTDRALLDAWREVCDG